MGFILVGPLMQRSALCTSVEHAGQVRRAVLLLGSSEQAHDALGGLFDSVAVQSASGRGPAVLRRVQRG